jgi:circadian clock protein KaiB
MSINYPRDMYVDSGADNDQASYSLRLYINGRSDRSIVARANLRRFCEEHLAGRYELEVIDLADNPRLAAEDRILATPTLVRRHPKPVKRIVGDLSNTEHLRQKLDIRKPGRASWG